MILFESGHLCQYHFSVLQLQLFVELRPILTEEVNDLVGLAFVTELFYLFGCHLVAVDETLLHSVHVTDGLKRDGAIIVNTPRSAEESRPLLRGCRGAVYTVDARAISEETLGKNFPNTPMLAAAAAVSGVMKKEDFLHEMRASFLHKFARKPEVVDGNMRALEMAYEVIERMTGMTKSA